MAAAFDPAIHRRARWRNLFNTWLILAGLVALVTLSAWLLFGSSGIFWAIGFAIFLMVAGPQVSPAMVLRLFRAKPLSVSQLPEVYAILRQLAERARLPAVPRLHYVASANMNAFAVGRPDDFVIAVTDGILRGLDVRQLTGVLAHEISHIANKDIRVMALADLVNKVTGILQTMGLFLLFFGLWQGGRAILAAPVLILAPTVGGLLQLALSRSREFDADLQAAQLTGDPEGLASALTALERRQGRLWESFVLPGSRLPDPSILRTHPSTKERVRRLLQVRGLDRQIELPAAQPLLPALAPVTAPPRFHRTGQWF